MAAALSRLSTLASLTSLSLEAGPVHGLLRHLRLPPGVKAGSSLSSTAYSGCRS